MNACGMSLLIIFYLINFSMVRAIVAVVIEPNNTVFRYQNMPVSYGHFELYFYSILESFRGRKTSFILCEKTKLSVRSNASII